MLPRYLAILIVAAGLVAGVSIVWKKGYGAGYTDGNIEGRRALPAACPSHGDVVAMARLRVLGCRELASLVH